MTDRKELYFYCDVIVTHKLWAMVYGIDIRSFGKVLQQTNSSLCSRNISVVSDYCLFLAEVIFQDFPAEVFVQRPRIIQSFIGFISTCNEPRYLLNALRSLTLFTQKLSDRLLQPDITDIRNTEAPGYPIGYEIEGPDCWEHEPIGRLQNL